MKLDLDRFARLLDYSLLHPATTEKEIFKFCEKIKKYKYGTAYVLPANLPLIKERLSDTLTRLGVGISFPFGTSTTATKCFECEEAIKSGAEDLDVVINIGAIKSSNYNKVLNELKELTKVVHPHILKIILEVSYLTKKEIIEGTKICCDAGVDFVKTATGFGSRETTINDVEIILNNITNDAKVKVAGGVNNVDTILKLYSKGVEKFGVSKGEQLVEEFIEKYNGEYNIEREKI